MDIFNLSPPKEIIFIHVRAIYWFKNLCYYIKKIYQTRRLAGGDIGNHSFICGCVLTRSINFFSYFFLAAVYCGRKRKFEKIDLSLTD